MKFNNSANNARDAVNVNTRGPQFMNSDGFYPSTMQFGFWNEMISIKMNPALPKDQQTDSKKFNYEEVVSTAITLEKATTLYTKIEEDIVPNLKGSEAMFRGVPVGGNSMFGVGIRKNDDESLSAYAAIFKSLDEDTKKPEIAIYYEFKSSYSVDDYDADTGKYSTTHNIPSELLLFVGALKEATVALTHANSHSSRAVDKFFRDRITNTMDEIGSKVGVEPKTKGAWANNNSGGYKSKNVFGDGGGSKQNTAADLESDYASTSKIQNLDDIEQFLH